MTGAALAPGQAGAQHAGKEGILRGLAYLQAATGGNPSKRLPGVSTSGRKTRSPPAVRPPKRAQTSPTRRSLSIGHSTDGQEPFGHLGSPDSAAASAGKGGKDSGPGALEAPGPSCRGDRSIPRPETYLRITSFFEEVNPGASIW
jgi:hypothetical protein